MSWGAPLHRSSNETMLRAVHLLSLSPLLTGLAGLVVLGFTPQKEQEDPVPTPTPQEEAASPDEEPAETGGENGGDDTKDVPEVDPAIIAAELEALRGRARDDFQVSDLDGNGWVSFHEALSTLHATREDFLVADLNQDGRLDEAEFVERQMTILHRVGSVISPSLPYRKDPDTGQVTTFRYPPLPSASTGEPEPADILRLIDRNADGKLQREELDQALTDLDIDLSADLLLRQSDPDGSGTLELHELGPLVGLLGPRLPVELLRASEDTWQAHLIYTTAIPREDRAGTLPRPPRILGPVTLFRRLDLSADGYIDREDLRKLTSPMRISVRPAAVLAALDSNGDGRLSSEEFRLSFGP